jgi:hypothetical protein
MWLKVTDATVKIYHDLKMVAVHPRLKRPGARSAVDENMPPEAIAYKLQDPQWCLRQAEAIGSDCHRLIQVLSSDRVLDNLRACQGGRRYLEGNSVCMSRRPSAMISDACSRSRVIIYH